MKFIVISIIFAGLLIGGAIIFSGSIPPEATNQAPTSRIVDGKQIFEIRARGGYSPRYSVGKSGIPSVLKIITEGTFDCSSAVIIPSLNYSANLDPFKPTEIEIPPQKPNSTITGQCAMGMYYFQLKFE